MFEAVGFPGAGQRRWRCHGCFETANDCVGRRLSLDDESWRDSDDSDNMKRGRDSRYKSAIVRSRHRRSCMTSAIARSVPENTSSGEPFKSINISLVFHTVGDSVTAKLMEDMFCEGDIFQGQSG